MYVFVWVGVFGGTGERALADMMFGTLEAKSDALASAQALERPKWMEVTPPEQWYVRRVDMYIY